MLGSAIRDDSAGEFTSPSLIPASAMIFLNIGTSLWIRAMWPSPFLAVTSKPASVSFLRSSGLERAASTSFSRKATASAGVLGRRHQRRVGVENEVLVA